MPGYITNIEEKTVENENFREVLFTAPHSQLVLMTLQPGEEIGLEVHPDVDQFFRIEKGQGRVILSGDGFDVSDGFAIVVPAGVEHNVVNTSDNEKLRLYTIYTPPQHPDKTIHKTKAEAESAE